MPPKKHRVHPVHPDDLVCDTCPARSPWMSSAATTIDRARFKGWHVFDGASETGRHLKVTLCETCFSKGAPGRPRGPVVLDGQGALFDVTPAPTQRKSKKQQHTS